MFKKILLAAAILIASPTIVSAQDIFWSFDSTSVVNNIQNQIPGSSGTAYIFSDGLFGFDALDLNFTSSNSAVLLFTDGLATNPTFNAVGGTRFDASVITIDPGMTGSADNGNLFAVNVNQNGVNPTLGPLFDPGFDANVGPNGAVLLAEVNYEIGLSGAPVDLSFSLGFALQNPSNLLDPEFGTATINGFPEPSSVILLVLGSVGLVARRKRS